MKQSIYAVMTEAQVNVLRASLADRARTLYPELWAQCRDVLGGSSPNLALAYEKDRSVSGKVTFCVPPKRDGDDVRMREAYFSCINPTAVEPIWSMVNDWKD